MPTLLIKHGGWDYDGCGQCSEGWQPGTAPVVLALQKALPEGGREELRKALQGQSVGLTLCKDRRLKGRIALPAHLLACMPDVPEGRKELRPGAVMYDPVKGELFFYLRK